MINLTDSHFWGRVFSVWGGEACSFSHKALVDAIPDSALKKVKEISDQLINGEISRGEAERKVREWVPVKFKSRTSELLSTCMAQSQKEKRGIVRPYETPAMINMKCGLNRLKSALGSVSEALK